MTIRRMTWVMLSWAIGWTGCSGAMRHGGSRGEGRPEIAGEGSFTPIDEAPPPPADELLHDAKRGTYDGVPELPTADEGWCTSPIGPS